MRARPEVLRELLEATHPTETLVRELSQFGWDSEVELELLRRRHLIAMLDSFLAGRKTASDVRRWAEAIEARDDIGFEAGAEEVLKSAIFELANPEITHNLSPLLAEKIRRDLA